MVRWLTLRCIKVPQAHMPQRLAKIALIGSKSAMAPKGARGSRHLKQYISPAPVGRLAAARPCAEKDVNVRTAKQLWPMIVNRQQSDLFPAPDGVLVDIEYARDLLHGICAVDLDTPCARVANAHRSQSGR
jgi:hypothetical protein